VSVLPFLPRLRLEVEVSEHLPGVDAGLRLNPGAVGGDHQTPEQAVTPGVPASMRRVLLLECTCGFHWQAPGAGACPRCHSSEVVALSEHHCVLRRS